MPETEPIVPIPVLLLLHTPTPTAATSLKVIVVPVHTGLVPVITPAEGAVFTLTICSAVNVPQEALETV